MRDGTSDYASSELAAITLPAPRRRGFTVVAPPPPSWSLSIQRNPILRHVEKPLRKVIRVRENAPAGLLRACRCVILISRTRRRNARPYLRSRRKVDVPMMSPGPSPLLSVHPNTRPPAGISLSHLFRLVSAKSRFPRIASR